MGNGIGERVFLEKSQSMVQFSVVFFANAELTCRYSGYCFNMVIA